MKDYCHYSLLQHNTFGMEAQCSRFLQYESVEEACQVAAILRTAGLPFVIIGAGSNLLLTRDYEGIVVRSGMKGIANDNGSVTVASGECGEPVAHSGRRGSQCRPEHRSLWRGSLSAD